MPTKKPKMTPRERKDKETARHAARRADIRSTQTPEELRAALDHNNELQRARRQSQTTPRRTYIQRDQATRDETNAQRRDNYANLPAEQITAVRTRDAVSHKKARGNESYAAQLLLALTMTTKEREQEEQLQTQAMKTNLQQVAKHKRENQQEYSMRPIKKDIF